MRKAKRGSGRVPLKQIHSPEDYNVTISVILIFQILIDSFTSISLLVFRFPYNSEVSVSSLIRFVPYLHCKDTKFI